MLLNVLILLMLCILSAFVSRYLVFVAHLFVTYVRHILKYTCQLWSPSAVQLINRVEGVQRMFTKRIRCIANLSYDEHLDYLGLHILKLGIDVLINCFYINLNLTIYIRQ